MSGIWLKFTFKYKYLELTTFIFYQGNIVASLQPKNFSRVQGKHHSSRSPRASAGIMELKKFHAKVKVLQKTVADSEGLLEHGVVSGTNVNGETRKMKSWKLNERTRLVGAQKKKDIILNLIQSDGSICKNVKLLKDRMSSGVKYEQMTKDIELDVRSTSPHEADFVVETDDNTHKVWEPTALKNTLERSEYPSSELVQELSVDYLGLPKNYNESLREWIYRVNSFLSTDAQRLLDLEIILKELKNKIETSEMKCQPSALELSTIKLQVKEAEEALMQLINFNYKITKMVETFSLSSDSNKHRSKVLERVQRGAGKIDRLEVKLQKVQCLLLELQEELECKADKSSERRSRIPLKDLIYGKRSDSRKMKRQFCACMRLKTKEK